MTIKENIELIKEDFNKCSDWEAKYIKIIKFGKGLDPMPEVSKLEKFKIKGCQSQVWLSPSFENGLIVFQADSDSVLVKGIIAVLLKVYSNQSPSDILENKPEFLDSLGIRDHLSMNRSNGLTSMIKQIQMYALVYNAMGSSNANTST
jgi:cysteine desulfuration protein SufE